MSNKTDKEKNISEEVDSISTESAMELFLLGEKIKLPITWKRLDHLKVKIQDLQASMYEKVLRLIKKHYIPTDPLFSSLNVVQDSAAVNEFLNICLFWMDSTMSLIAVREDSDKLIGVLIGRTIHLKEKTRSLSKVRVYNKECLKKIFQLYVHCEEKCNMFNKFKIEDYYKIYIIAVHPKYRRKGIGSELIQSAVKQCKRMDVLTLVGLFPTIISQKMFYCLGGKYAAEILYENWVDNEYDPDRKMIFDNPGPGNDSIAWMYLYIPREADDQPPPSHKDETIPRLPEQLRRSSQFASHSGSCTSPLISKAIWQHLEKDVKEKYVRGKKAKDYKQKIIDGAVKSKQGINNLGKTEIEEVEDEEKIRVSEIKKKSQEYNSISDSKQEKPTNVDVKKLDFSHKEIKHIEGNKESKQSSSSIIDEINKPTTREERIHNLFNITLSEFNLNEL